MLLLLPHRPPTAVRGPLTHWAEGAEDLLVHVYGTILYLINSLIKNHTSLWNDPFACLWNGPFTRSLCRAPLGRSTTCCYALPTAAVKVVAAIVVERAGAIMLKRRVWTSFRVRRLARFSDAEGFVQHLKPVVVAHFGRHVEIARHREDYGLYFP